MPIGRIQRDARGLLNFLQIVGQTERPNALDETVRGVMDMIPFWGSLLFQSRRLTGAVQNPGDTVSLAVPQGEAWYMIGGQYGVLAGAANEAVACSYLVVMAPDSVPIRLASFARKTSMAATAQLLQGHDFAQPFILSPGSSVQMTVDDSNLGVARTGAVAAICYPFAV